MKKYEAHGLTDAQDRLLGGFGDSTRENPWSQSLREVETYPVGWELSTAATELQRKGLLRMKVQPGGDVELTLTQIGKKLWKIRAKEEELPR